MLVGVGEEPAAVDFATAGGKVAQDMGKEKYWIVIAVIGLNVALIAAHMAGLFTLLDSGETYFVVTVLESLRFVRRRASGSRPSPGAAVRRKASC